MGYILHTLGPQTWLIEEEAPECNVYMYLLAGEQRALLIDSGYGTIPLDTIAASLTELPVTVLCTHGHFDHIGGIGFFPCALMHRADRQVYQQHRLELRNIAPHCMAPEAPLELQWFGSAFSLDLGNRILEIIPVPGHTGGCIAVLDSRYRQLFTGDTCCKGAILLNFDHSGDLAVYRESVASILKLRDRFDTTWPAHHQKPVGLDIPMQFLEAADLILKGQLQGTEVPNPYGPARMVAYKDISVLY